MRLDSGFRPSVHGFAFPNAWHDTLVGVVPSRGRCGGMVFAALDYFVGGTPLPPEAVARDLPPHRSSLARYIWRRQVDSVVLRGGSNLARFASFTYLPSGAPSGIGETTRRELLTLFDSLRAGRPAPLGLVSALSLRHLARNHQVLAYAADFGERAATISVYDPNHPLRDDITFEVPLAPEAPVSERVGGRSTLWRGMFVERYGYVLPPDGISRAESDT